MRWFSRKKRPEIFIEKSTIEFIDHSLHFIAKHFGPDKEGGETQLPSHEYYCDRQDISTNEIKALVEKISRRLHLESRIEVHQFSGQKNGYETLFCNHQFAPDTAQAIFLPDGMGKYPVHLTASIVQQLCEIEVTKVVKYRVDLKELATLLSFCCGFGIFHVLSLTTPNSTPHINLSPLKYKAMLYCAASLHDLGFNSIDKYQFYIDSDSWIRLRDLVNVIPDQRGRYKFREEWNRSLQQAADFQIAYGKPLHEDATLEALERLATGRPDDYNIAHNLAYARLLRGQFEAAIKGFDFAISSYPFFAYAFNNRGLCNIFLGKLGAALEDLKTSARLDPENSFNVRNFGIYWLTRNQPRVALDEFLKAQKMDPDTEHIHYWLGRAYLMLGQNAEALSEFELSRQVPELPVPSYPPTY